MRQIIFKSLVLTLSLLLVREVSGQDCNASLSGRIIDEHDQQPLSLANIFIPSLNRGTTSDTLGYYFLDKLCPGTYVVQVTHLGCEPITDTLSISGNTKKDFFPEHHVEELRLFSVEAELEAEISSAICQFPFEKMRPLNFQSIGKMVEDVKGVTALSTGAHISKPVINGLHSNRIVVMNNEIRQEGQQWGSEHGPEIDPFMADNITVIKGAAGVRYGPEAMGGVILIEPKPLPDSAGIGGRLNLAGDSNGRKGATGFMLEGKSGKIPALSMRVQGSVTKSGNTKAPDYYLKNTGNEELNFSLTAGYNTKKAGAEVYYSQFNSNVGIFAGAHIENLSDLQNAFNAGAPLDTADFTYEIEAPYQHIEHELTKVKSYLNTGKNSKLIFTFGRQYNLREEFDAHGAEEGREDHGHEEEEGEEEHPALEFELTTHTAELLLEHKWKKSLSGSVGVTGISQKNTYEGRFFIPNYKKQGLGVFLFEQYVFDKQKLTLEAGIRGDYIYQQVFMWKDEVIISPVHEFNGLSGSLGGLKRLGKYFDWRLSLSAAWRPPSLNELYSDGLHHGAAAYERGDAELTTEKLRGITSQLIFERKKLDVDVEVYHNYIKDFIYLQPESQPAVTVRGVFPAFRFSQTNAALTGLNASVGYEIKERLKFKSTATLLRARNLETNEYLVMMPSDRFRNTLTYEFKDKGRLGKPYVSVSVSSVFKQWRVPQNSDYVEPPDEYHLVGLNAGSSIRVGKQKMDVGIYVTNLFNTSYREYMSRLRYFTDEPGRNISFRLSIPFHSKSQPAK